MHVYFSIPDIAAEAAHSLDYLCMNSDDQIAIYNITFLWYSAELQWIEDTLCHRYYFGLPNHIQDIISTHKEGKPSTFGALYSTAISTNNYFWERKHESKRALQHSLYPECPESISNLLLSDSDSNIKALESSDEFPAWRHTLSLDLSDSDSESSSSVSDFGSIVSESSTSTLLQILLLELSDSASSLSSLTSGSDPGILESLVKLKSLVDLLSRLGSNLSLESLF